MLERRAVVLGLVIAIHALAVLALLASHRREALTVDDTITTLLFFVPPAEPASSATNRGSASRRPYLKRVETPPAGAQTPLILPDEEPPPSPIDWRSDGTRAAANILREADEISRQRAALEPHGGIQLGDSTRPPPGIAWETAHTRRIEPLAEGGTLIHLNDRCVIVFPFMLPICKVGKTEPRGDLFDHMNDLPEALTRPSAP